ncbi:MAG: hypothetical protein A2Y33_13435 [Spirochaetes bacterium GWF1_51_8]|nr:MAG: hypothetical protein A2Y33_13435 [Spirochaetes bacterium GWF1_51_8]
MKRSVKIVVIAFFVFTFLFTLYQTLMGNPFYDEIPPAAVQIGCLVIAGAAVFAVMRERKKKAKDSKPK